MGARAPAPNSFCGATEIQKNFAARARLILGAVAAAAAVGTAAQLTRSDSAFPAGTTGAWLAVLVVVMGLLQGRGRIFPFGVGALVAAALLDLLHGSLATAQIPLIGGAMLAIAEFGYWSFEFEAGIMPTQPVIVRRVGVILGLVVLGVGLSAVVAIPGIF